MPAASSPDAERACPVHRAPKAARKTAPPRDPDSRDAPREPTKDAAGVWHVTRYDDVRAVLRQDVTRQAGFRAELIGKLPRTMREPILYQEGEAHRTQRTEIARYFTPTATDKKYRGMMESFADEVIAGFRARGQADLSELSMKMAVQVAAQVVGLTNSRLPGMAGRIEAFFDQQAEPFRWRPKPVGQLVLNQYRVAKFYLLDVLPAIRSRRAERREDVISHLLDQGYKNAEIMTECITYGAAGMATTREFICAAAWHFLERPELRARFLVAGERERYAVLHEILRLEPVVGTLYRRATREVLLGTLSIPAGELIALHIYTANADPEAVGEGPLEFCPERSRAKGVPEPVLSFGDGHHRCPGAFVAVQESDIFLRKLLALDTLKLEQPPTLSFNAVVAGYELRDFRVRC